MRPQSLVLAGALLAGACSPTLDWREVHPADSAAQLLFPCKPASHAREIDLAGARTKVTLYACEAAGMTWALAFAQLADPGALSTALLAWRKAAESNVGATQSLEVKQAVTQGVTQTLTVSLPGQTPNPQAGRFRITGHRPDGTPVSSEVLLAAKGTQVIQVTALGSELDAAAVETFMQSVRLLP